MDTTCLALLLVEEPALVGEIGLSEEAIGTQKEIRNVKNNLVFASQIRLNV